MRYPTERPFFGFNWSCIGCDDHGPAKSEDDAFLKATAHARGCPGVAKRHREQDLSDAAPELAAMLRKITASYREDILTEHGSCGLDPVADEHVVGLCGIHEAEDLLRRLGYI